MLPALVPNRFQNRALYLQRVRARARSTFICILMILIQGIGQTIYQQVVRLIEVGQ